jgi:hypothetical protein
MTARERYAADSPSDRSRQVGELLAAALERIEREKAAAAADPEKRSA